jgi:hypothetical protein
MGGVSGYFYNQLPDLGSVLDTVAAMRRRGLSELAECSGEAAGLFVGYAGTDPTSTWQEVQRQLDPAGRLGELSERINAIDNYGLNAVHIR